MGALHGLPALVKALQVCRPELFPAFPALRLTGTPSEPTTHAYAKTQVLAALRPLDLQAMYQRMTERGLSARTVRYAHV